MHFFKYNIMDLFQNTIFTNAAGFIYNYCDSV